MSLSVQSISLVSVAQDTRSSLDQNKTDPAGKALGHRESGGWHVTT